MAQAVKADGSFNQDSLPVLPVFDTASGGAGGGGGGRGGGGGGGGRRDGTHIYGARVVRAVKEYLGMEEAVGSA